MSLSARPRELLISQGHVGTVLLAGLIGLTATCVVATLMMALIFQVADSYAWVGCLFLPAVGLVLVASTVLWQWSERHLPRVWPSGKRLVLGQEDLTLARRNRVYVRILWDQPATVLRWRLHGTDAAVDGDHPPGRLHLACQLTQQSHTISVYTGCSPQEWRRVPGWKQFPLLERGEPRGQSAVLRDLVVRSVLRRPPAAPAFQGFSSLSKGDPKLLWPAELQRRRSGWALSFEDFCALMTAVEPSNFS